MRTLGLALCLLLLLLWWWQWRAEPPIAIDFTPPEATVVEPAEALTVRAADDYARELPAVPGLPMSPRTAAVRARLQVRVRGEDGLPLPAILVVVGPTALADPFADERTATADAAGNAEFELPLGSWRCRTALGGEVPATLADDTPTVVTLVLPRGRTLQGRVVDDTGRPLAAATVLLVDKHGAERALPVARTAADGTFTLADAAKSCWLAAEHPDCAPAVPILAVAATECRLVLVRAFGRVQGRVVDAAAKPVADAVVVLGAGADTTAAGDVHKSPTPPLQLLRTDAEGRFASGPLGTGQVAVRAQKAGSGSGRSTAIVTPEITAAVEVQLLPFATVLGTVRDDAGAPLPGAWVFTVPLHAFGCRLVATDTFGSYALEDVAAGAVSLQAVRGDAKATATFPLAPGAQQPWDPVLRAHPIGRLRGRIVDHRDAPLAGWRVLAVPAGSEEGLGVETDAEGCFAIGNLPPTGTARLTVLAPESGWNGLPALRLPEVAIGSDDLVLAVPDPAVTCGAIALRVVGPTGEGVAALVDLQYERQPHLAVQPTTPDGHLRLERVPTGELRLQIRANDLPARRLSPITVLPSGQHDLGTIQLGRGGVLTGSLTGNDGRAPEGATIRLLDEARRDAGSAVINDTTYRTPLLPPGSYTLLVQAEGFAAARAMTRIEAGRELTFDLQLQNGIAHRITVTSPAADQQSAITSIMVFDRQGQPLVFAHRPMVRGRGEFVVGLAPGEYSVIALGVANWRAQATFAVTATTTDVASPTHVELQPPR